MKHSACILTRKIPWGGTRAQNYDNPIVLTTNPIPRVFAVIEIFSVLGLCVVVRQAGKHRRFAGGQYNRICSFINIDITFR